MNKEIHTVEEYISGFPAETREKLETMRHTIKICAPDATEGISYGMPAYKLNKKPLVYFGGFAQHLGFYATPNGHQQFKEELSVYKQGKGSVQFPLSQPLPVDLIADIVKFRVSELTRK